MTATPFKMERFVIIVKRPILDVAAVLDPPLMTIYFSYFHNVCLSDVVKPDYLWIVKHLIIFLHQTRSEIIQVSFKDLRWNNLRK